MPRKQEFHVGIALLKAVLSFYIVLIHYWRAQPDISGSSPLPKTLGGVGVAAFLLISFLLTERSLSAGSLKQLGRRVGRLMIPQVAWAVIPALAYVVLDSGLGIRVVRLRSLSTVGWQILTGNTTINNVMWYMVDLIVLTCVAGALYAAIKSDDARTYALVILMIVAIHLQQSGVNYRLCAGLRTELSSPVGKLLELTPYMCIGLLASRYGWFEKAKKHALINALIGAALWVLVDAAEWFALPQGFAHFGMARIVKTAALVLAFYVMPLEKAADWVKKVIRFLSGYALGVYCLHRFVGRMLNTVLFPRWGWTTYTFWGCVLNYALCLLLSFAISKIPGKWARRTVM